MRRGRGREREVTGLFGGVRLGGSSRMCWWPAVWWWSARTSSGRVFLAGGLAARAYSRRSGLPWTVARREKVKQSWTLTMDGETALVLLREAGWIGGA